MNRDERAELVKYIIQCFNTLDTFGKTPDQLADACFIFIDRLAGYDFREIRNAFGVYMDTHTDMPKPANIINIINPPAPKPDWAAYVSIRQRMKDPYTFVMDDEKAYVRYCERYSVDNLKSYEERKEAQEQLAEAQSRLLPSGSNTGGDDFDHSI